jgi:PAS domain S-box-containing protein
MTVHTAVSREVFFSERELIVSKTDLKGRITYANKTFCKIAGYAEHEILGKPHSLVRHPDMPRTIFKALWDTISDGREIFAYVKNMTKSGDPYWVFAHVTPSFDPDGKIIGYHSNRRAPKRAAVEKVITPLYAKILAEEARHKNGKEALAAGFECLNTLLNAKGLTYEAFVLTL